MNKKIKRFAITTIICVLVASIFGTVMVLAPPPDFVFPELIDVFVTNTSDDPVPVDVQNTPLPVEVTNPSGMPIATNCTYVYHLEGMTGANFEHELFTRAESTDIGDRTVVFTGGSVCGSIVFTSEDGAGGATARGIVGVERTTGPNIIWTLPLNSMFRVEHVNTIHVFVSVIRPCLRGPSSYFLDVSASVLWYIEE